MSVAIIGFGTMGRVAAQALIDGGTTVVASDPAPGAETSAHELGADFAATPRAAVETAEVALLFLPGPTQIEQVVGAIAEAAPGLTVVDHSTADPATAQAAAAALTPKGHGWVDAPILGRPSAVGNWTLPIGQSEGALASCRAVLDSYAASIIEVGGPGSGHTVKLLNQMMFGAINAMTAEMMAVAERVGVEPGRLAEILTGSRAGTVSNLFVELGNRIGADDYDNPAFSVRLLEKDVRLGLDMAAAAGCDAPLGRVIASFNEHAIAEGLGEKDTSVMWQSRS